MISRRELFFKQCAAVTDGVLITAAFFTAHSLRLGSRFSETYSFETYLLLFPVFLALWLGLLAGNRVYRKPLSPRPFRAVLTELARVHLVGALTLTAGLYLLKMGVISRVFVLLFVLLGFLFLTAERLLLRGFLRVARARGVLRKNIVVVGAGPRARGLIRRLSDEVPDGAEILGVLDTRPELVGSRVGGPGGAKIIETLDALPAVLRAYPVDEVVFVVPRNWMERLEEPVRQCELMGVCATVAVDMFNLRLAKAQLSSLCGVPVVSLDTVPPDEWKMALKRLMDIGISGACLLALSPILLAAAVLVKATSPGPVFFRQVRIGLHGRRFTLYKFRSMTADAELRRAEVEGLNEMNGPAFKAANDPRITPAGKWLRRWSIDEMPQLYNVLKGEMSLVGPRPPLPGEAEQYENWQSRRLSVKPGITGYWQVEGRSRIRDFEKWARLDLEYIDRWSLGFDMKILLRTIPAVMSGNGAE